MVINNSQCPEGGAHEYVEVVNDNKKQVFHCAKCGGARTEYK